MYILYYIYIYYTYKHIPIHYIYNQSVSIVYISAMLVMAEVYIWAEAEANPGSENSEFTNIKLKKEVVSGIEPSWRG